MPTRVCVARNGRLAAAALAFSLVYSLASVAPALAASATIQPSNQDAFVLKSQPNRITGAKNLRLRVQGSPNNSSVRRALVQFPLGAIPPGSTVTSAVISLFAGTNVGNPTLTHGLYRVLAPWQENTVKWNNQPAAALVPTATAIVGTGRGFKNFDVTADVQSAVNLCSADHGWLIKDVAETATNDSQSYTSQEEPHPGELQDRPRLIVTFDPPACVTDADCQDSNLCTINEKCVAGLCAVEPLTCDDNDPCTTDVCDCGQGCRAQPNCDDGLSCTNDVCDPATLECSNTPLDSACVTECSTGTCVGDPDSPIIDPNTGCHIETKEPAGTPCSDGEACTAPDECNEAGACVPGPKDCEGNPSCETHPLCFEQCDNCIDDNQNGLVDRDDPICTPVANGGGQGAGDPKFRGKPVLRCQKAIRTAASKFASQLRTRLQKCSDAVFLCLQQKPGDTACLDKAKARCLKQAAVLQTGPNNLETKLGVKITKACGPKKPGLLPVVAGADLCDAKGLGFGSEVAACQTPQSAVLLATVISSLAEVQRCRTLQVFAADVPRAAELLTAGGIDLTQLPCLAGGAQGGLLGLGKPADVVKAVVSCQRGIGTAGARFVAQVLAAEQRCSEAVAQCIQTKPGNAKCLTKAQNLCRKITSKLYAGPQSREAKLKTVIARACGTTKVGGTPRVALTDLRSILGLGYDSLQTACTTFGVPSLASLDDVSECLVRQHVCRADQLLVSQTPRAHELLTTGGAVSR